MRLPFNEIPWPKAAVPLLVLIGLLIVPAMSWAGNEVRLYERKENGRRANGVIIPYSTTEELAEALAPLKNRFDEILVLADSIIELPNEFFKFSKVTILYLEGQYLDTLDARLIQMGRLESIEINCYSIQAISKELARLPELEGIVISAKGSKKSIRRDLKRVLRTTRSHFLHVSLDGWVRTRERKPTKPRFL